MDTLRPRPARVLVFATHALLAALFAVGIVAIVFLPAMAASAAEAFPEYKELEIPLLGLSIAFTVLGLMVLALTSLLVHRIYRGTVLTRTSLLWVDGIIALLACAVLIVIVASVVISKGQAGSPFGAMCELVTCLTLSALACIILVLRSLLRQAILLRTELDEVV